jgi:hypothetical protein
MLRPPFAGLLTSDLPADIYGGRSRPLRVLGRLGRRQDAVWCLSRHGGLVTVRVRPAEL